MSPNSKQTKSFHVERSSSFGLNVYLSNLSKVLIDSGSWYSDTSPALVLVLSIVLRQTVSTSTNKGYKRDYPQSMLFVIGSYYTFLKSLDVLHGSVSDFPKTWTWLAKPLLNFTTTTTNWQCGKCYSHVLNYNYTTIQLQLTMKHSLLIQLTSWVFFSSLGAMRGNVLTRPYSAKATPSDGFRRKFSRCWVISCRTTMAQHEGKSQIFFRLVAYAKHGFLTSLSHKALGWRNFNEWRVGDVVSVQQFIVETPCVFVQVFTLRLSSNYIYCIISLQELRWQCFEDKSEVWKVIEIDSTVSIPFVVLVDVAAEHNMSMFNHFNCMDS